MKPGRKARIGKPDIVGWREIVALPELNIPALRVKIDTGARTSAIHAEQISVFDRAGQSRVKFRVPKSIVHKPVWIDVPVHDERAIKNTSGVPETRLIIEVLMLLGRHRWRIELSLANRANMGFDMILGRTAIRNRNILVNPGRSFLMGAPGHEHATSLEDISHPADHIYPAKGPSDSTEPGSDL
ncbi:hypothetical protein GCM10011316_05830 [Roseibium aquae]|uniref:Retropepsin-like aspartic endopeptidase domain-containing protein n=1 Tax=Roseibium aquae TaxID=1323746 RepID=A0A916TAI1_9HYPH|nr:RimK/LysX family protein [Roseibium aquae]GGB36514.1 hypothetical protein GCM10011316_05830 [Roseibium aquae]